MKNKELYKQAFGVLHSSVNISLEDCMNKKEEKNRPFRKPLVACACLALTLVIGATAYAYGGEVIRQIFGWENNLKIETLQDENGNEVSETMLYTDNLTDPVIIEDGKLYFIANDEHIDITDQVSDTDYFQYEYADPEENTHILLIGLNSRDISEYGYAEYIKDPSGNWVGGCSARVNINPDGSPSAEWIKIAKGDLGIPW